MKLRPLNPSMHAAQSTIFEVALELTRLDRRLFELVQALPLPSDVFEMWEDQVPDNVCAHLVGIVQVVRSDLFKDAIATLMAAAQKTEEDLRKEFLERTLPIPRLPFSDEDLRAILLKDEEEATKS